MYQTSQPWQILGRLWIWTWEDTYLSSFFSSLGGPILTIIADLLNFLTCLIIFTGSASPITVAVFFEGSRTTEVIPSIAPINFMTFCLHFEQSSSTDTTVFCIKKRARVFSTDSELRADQLYSISDVLKKYWKVSVQGKNCSERWEFINLMHKLIQNTT